jgi:predicted transcriptional regulator/prophage maintenance system killer protein
MTSKIDNINQLVIDLITKNKSISTKDIFQNLNNEVSIATLKRTLLKLVKKELVVANGKGKSTTYTLSKSYQLLNTIDIEKYFEQEIDERKIKSSYDFDLINGFLEDFSIFTDEELTTLNLLNVKYLQNIAELSKVTYDKELERLAIDLSWKSSQIEGNTYSLLETERLLQEKQTAQGKTKDEAVMLLNHKDTLDFIIENQDFMLPASIAKIEMIHSLLIKELGVSRNIRVRKVGISGTNYVPLDNDFQIREALEQTCMVINKRTSIFEKAFLALILLSYIQPFEDGNKRTARIVSNAILIQGKHCPISFRTVDSIEYKKAMLIFYEQNNISAFKKIFIQQFEFAVKTYF